MSPDSERGPVDRPALARCVTVDPSRFGSEYWGRRPLLSRSAELVDDFDDLFGTDAVDELVSARGLRTPFIRMAREGSVLPASAYTDSGGYGAEIGDQVDSARVLSEFAAGSTIVLQGLHRTWSPIGEFTRQLVADVGHPCQVNAYVTPASSRGFDPHYDVHDVFVIQIAGEKHWTIHEPVHVDPLRDQPWSGHRSAVAERAAGTPAIDETLRPGDVLYLPRGWIHSATALGGTSIHLTVGMAAVTRFDVLEQLVAGLADDPTLRASLPLGAGNAGPSQLADLIAQVVTDAAARLLADDTLPARAAESVVRRVASSTRPAPIRPLATVDALASVDAETVVRWREGSSARIRDTVDQVTAVLDSKSVALPAEASAALHRLGSGDALRVGDFPGLDPESARVVARRLLREGIVVIA